MKKGEGLLKYCTRLAMRGVDERFGLVVAESRDVARADAGKSRPSGSASLRNSLVVRACSVGEGEYCSSGRWWRHHSFQLLIPLK